MFVGGILLKKKARAIKQGVRSAGSGGLQVEGSDQILVFAKISF
jgi:hypothetical protein